MSINQSTILSILRRKTAVVVLLVGSAVCSFAIKPILGDDRGKNANRSLLQNNQTSIPSHFTLKSDYNYRGRQIMNDNKQRAYINLNTTVTYQKGKTTYIVPLKKKVYINQGNGFGINVNH
jgi:hypothetical protein